MKSPSRAVPSELRAAQRQIDSWRTANGGRRRIPESFWARAATLAGTYGINPVSVAMRLSHERIRAGLESIAIDERRDEPPVRFVEMTPSSAVLGAASGVSMELNDGTGRRMRVAGADGQAAGHVVAAFFGTPPS